MRKLGIAAALSALAAVAPAVAQEREESRHGSWDRAGAANMMTELNAIQAANIIRRGRVVELGRDYGAHMPMGPGKSLRLSRSVVRSEAATRVESHLSAPIGAGTSLAGLGAIGRPDDGGGFYNGLAAADVAPEEGPGELGIERVRPFFTRGIMIDMVTVRGGPMAAGEEITVEDIETALAWFGLDEPGHGDAVLFHTGWGRHWGADNDTYLSGAPGIGAAAAQWLIARDVALVGADTWSVERQAPGGPRAFPVHVEMTAGHGIYLHRNLETERLIDAEIAEFAYIFAPLHVVGATASPGAPLAVY